MFWSLLCLAAAVFVSAALLWAVLVWLMVSVALWIAMITGTAWDRARWVIRRSRRRG